MPTFIDESGCTGHSATSKPYFRLAAVWIPTQSDADFFRTAVRQLRTRLNLPVDYEFKFSEMRFSPQHRRDFFNLAMGHPFRFSVCSIDKSRGKWKFASKSEQHWAVATSVAAYLKDDYMQAEDQSRLMRDPVWVDRNDDQKFLDAIRIAFQGLRSRFHPGQSFTESPRFRKSHPDEMLQLVDMVCGASGSHLDGQDSEWFNMIKAKCSGLIPLP